MFVKFSFFVVLPSDFVLDYRSFMNHLPTWTNFWTSARNEISTDFKVRLLKVLAIVGSSPRPMLSSKFPLQIIDPRGDVSKFRQTAQNQQANLTDFQNTCSRSSYLVRKWLVSEARSATIEITWSRCKHTELQSGKQNLLDADPCFVVSVQCIQVLLCGREVKSSQSCVLNQEQPLHRSWFRAQIQFRFWMRTLSFPCCTDSESADKLDWSWIPTEQNRQTEDNHGSWGKILRRQQQTKGILQFFNWFTIRNWILRLIARQSFLHDALSGII